jgi:hypothetical protein
VLARALLAKGGMAGDARSYEADMADARLVVRDEMGEILTALQAEEAQSRRAN